MRVPPDASHPRAAEVRRRLLLALAAAPALAAARTECRRSLVVPVAPTGFNVRLDPDGSVHGVYPDLLRLIGERSACRFEFPVVPRARINLMFFGNHQADLFIPASRTAERDQQALFVPMLRLTPCLITLRSRPQPVESVEALLARPGLRGAIVRGYSSGDDYEALARRLEAARRIDQVTDLHAVGAMLRSRHVDFSILPPTLLYSALQDGHPEPVDRQEFRYTPLAGLPRSEVGAYLSRETLSGAELDQLRGQLELAVRDGSLQRTLERYYPAEILRADVRIGRTD